MFRFLLLIFLICSAFVSEARDDLRIVAVIGAAGSEEYEEIFAETADLWASAAEKSGAAFQVIGRDEDTTPEDASRLREVIQSIREPELWLVLIGHGTFDGREAKFNVRGADFTDAELAQWLEAYTGSLTVINTASASGSFVERLAGPDRVVITATKSATEIYFTRFGRYFAEAVSGEPQADLDNDDQVSLLECFLYASDRVAKFYESEGRLATEHAIIDDNGDGLGSRAEWFEGVVATRTPGTDAEPDGERTIQQVLIENAFERSLTAAQKERRNRLEQAVKALRRKKADLPQDDYYHQLESLLLQLAELYREVESS